MKEFCYSEEQGEKRVAFGHIVFINVLKSNELIFLIIIGFGCSNTK